MDYVRASPVWPKYVSLMKMNRSLVKQLFVVCNSESIMFARVFKRSDSTTRRKSLLQEKEICHDVTLSGVLLIGILACGIAMSHNILQNSRR